jgi:hypothetical protein
VRTINVHVENLEIRKKTLEKLSSQLASLKSYIGNQRLHLAYLLLLAPVGVPQRQVDAILDHNHGVMLPKQSKVVLRKIKAVESAAGPCGYTVKLVLRNTIAECEAALGFMETVGELIGSACYLYPIALRSVLPLTRPRPLMLSAEVRDSIPR